MADARDIITCCGGRSDLQIDVSRCLRMRFSESTCSRCVDICPHGAVNLDETLSIDQQKCSGCLLCTSVCPSGSLEQKLDFTACLAHLSRMPEAVLGCVRTKEAANATLACLGGLSEEHLLALCHSLSGELTLNLALCDVCPNNLMIVTLQKRLARLTNAGLLRDGCRIVVAESVNNVRYRAESLGRRDFLLSLRCVLMQGAVEVLSESSSLTERQPAYSGKRVPVRRELLNRICERIATALADKARYYFNCQIAIFENCTACQACVAICPTGALQHVSPDCSPEVVLKNCSGCGLCVEFCLDQAIRIRIQNEG